MAKREFEGTITFNHDESEMNIRVSQLLANTGQWLTSSGFGEWRTATPR